ncbi:MAG TPA: RNB domain-containing ribonuclease [Acidimicrobiia bacterium]|jgi:exoribonuclease R
MRRRIRVVQIADVFEAIRRRADLPDEFPPEVLEEAEHARPADDEREDLRDLPFVTIDPPESLDLDQAIHLEERHGDGIRLHYAIADVASFVLPGGALDAEARRRGTTVYCPDRRIPLHPPVLSEGSASLLPGDDRAAVVFRIDLDSSGDVEGVDVVRATIRVRERFDYLTVQSEFDAGRPPEPISLLRRFGETRIARGIERGALSVRLPEQEVVKVGDRWTIVSRPELPAERWNAEASLLAGMVGAEIMLDIGTGILRTLPPAIDDTISTLREVAARLGVDGARDETPAEMLAGLDPVRPRHLAVFEAATRLLRGSGYVGFSGGRPAGDLQHAGVAAPYAHVTAPLRRLVDRFALAVCLAAAAGRAVPEWVEEATEEVAAAMEKLEGRAGQVEAQCLNATEAWVMGERIADRFEAVVLGRDNKGVEIWIDDPPVMTRAPGVDAEPGEVIVVEVLEVDPDSGNIRLARTD